MTSGTYLVIAIIRYFNHDSGFPLFMVLFWLLTTFLFFQQCFGIVAVGFVYWTLSTFLLKYSFEEMLKIIELSLKSQNPIIILKAIYEHNRVIKICSDLNDLFKYLLFIIYYMSSPMLIFIFYYIMKEYKDIRIVIILSPVLILVYTVVFLINLFSSQIARTAKKPNNLMYGYLSRKSVRLYPKLKILSFIERLSGADIGYYCLDLFPMNNYEFYLYITNCIKIYILCNELFKK